MSLRLFGSLIYEWLLSKLINILVHNLQVISCIDARHQLYFLDTFAPKSSPISTEIGPIYCFIASVISVVFFIRLNYKRQNHDEKPSSTITQETQNEVSSEKSQRSRELDGATQTR